MLPNKEKVLVCSRQLQCTQVTHPSGYTVNKVSISVVVILLSVLLNKGRHVTFELSQWQIKIGKKTVSIFLVYRPPCFRGNLYTGFKFVEEFGDFLGDKLNNTNIIMGDFNFNEGYVKKCENLVFQDLLQSFGLIQHVDFPTYQSGHTLDLIITKEDDTICISEPVDKFYISDHSCVHSEIRVNKPQAIRRTIRTRRIRNMEENKINKELEGIGEMIKRE